MTRAGRLILLPLALLSLTVITTLGASVSGATALGCIEEGVAGRAGSAPPLAQGSGIPALIDGSVVSVDPSGDRTAYAYAAPPLTTLRHAAALPGRGTAFVEDRKGSDAVVLLRPDGASVIDVSGEATHPAWLADGSLAYAVDLQRIEVRSPAGTVRSYPKPEGTTSVFSPVSVAADAIVGVVEEPVPDAHGDAESLDNLYRLDLGTGSWTRLTSFTGDAESWSVLRTPAVDPDGGLLFVRVHGLGSATTMPSFELWRLDGTASKVRDLPGESYLAAATESGLVWNVFVAGEWHLYLESAGHVRDLGCGAVAVDPRVQPDPDKAVLDEVTTDVEPGAALPAPASMAIAVGDFATRAQAELVASAIGSGSVIDAQSAPLAVVEGAYAVALPIPEGADLEGALDAFRGRFPGYAERSWIVTLQAGAS